MKIDYGPLKGLIADINITEVMVNAWDRVFVESAGIITEVQNRFVDERQWNEFIQQILHHCGRRQASEALFFDGILPEGHRFNITLPPSSMTPTLTIRKFRNKHMTLDDLVKAGSLSDKAARFLDAAVKARLSIVVSGGTGTGKTTILNSLAACIPGNERVISIQDVPELKLPLRNWVSIVTVDQPKTLSARDCLVNSLRMRPDRIIIGECRKDETFEMLQAMNTGHEGSMTTIHASTAQDALIRIESLMMYASFEMPIKVLRFQISQSIDLIVQVHRTASGKREISEIMELTGMENDTITRAPIFQRDKKGILAPMGYVPECLKKIHEAKIELPSQFF